jgi:hypothetical protein
MAMAMAMVMALVIDKWGERILHAQITKQKT